MLDELLRTLREWMDYQRMLSRKRILNSFPLTYPHTRLMIPPIRRVKMGLLQRPSLLTTKG